jgi:capsular exopolysaccharide synthesis family protein
MKTVSSAEAFREATESVRTLQNLRLRPGSKTVLGSDVPPLALEQYRRLGAVLHHAQQQNATRVLMISSAVPSEGKTLTAVNLALTLSESYHKRVILIDADLRRPTIHELLQLPNVTGLNEGLKTHGAWTPPVFELSPYFSVLTAGRSNPDPMSVITSDRMHRLLQHFAESYDWAVLDTPPIGLLPDAHLLTSMVDGVILVVAAGRAPYRLVERAVDALGHERIVGVVLNRIERAAIGQTYGYDAYQYYGRPRK